MTPLEQLIESLRNRKSQTRWGIGRAVSYLRSFQSCIIGAEGCPENWAGFDKSAWESILKEAENQLTYCDERLLIKGHSERDVPEQCCMTFDCVITSTRKDRDGDILESAGAVLDVKMPLLWQHNRLQPIGKFLSAGKRSKSYVSGKFAIIDQPLGRDAAELFKFGALRISHGFSPEEYEPLDEKSGGWRIKRFEILETSGVSVPSNVDAEVLGYEDIEKSFAQELDGLRTVFGRGMLKTEQMKRLAEPHYRNRKAQSTGVDLPVVKESLTADGEKEAAPACGCKGKSDSTTNDNKVVEVAADKDLKPAIEKMYGEYFVPGSFEEAQSHLRMSLRRHLIAAGKDEYCYCMVAGTFPGYAIVCCEERGEPEFYRIAWSYTNGKAEWSGTPAEVDLVVTAEVAGEMVEEGKSKNNPSLKSVIADLFMLFPGVPAEKQAQTINRLTRIAKATKVAEDDAAFEALFA